jgi:hypothetical protein
MNPKYYYIQKDNQTEKIPLESQDKINLCGMNLIELILPPCKKVYCSCNNLTKLIIPEGCEVVGCSNNKLTELILPKSCVVLDCANNKLIKLITSKNCKIVFCENNKLRQTIINLFDSQDPVKIQLASNLQR